MNNILAYIGQCPSFLRSQPNANILQGVGMFSHKRSWRTSSLIFILYLLTPCIFILMTEMHLINKLLITGTSGRFFTWFLISSLFFLKTLEGPPSPIKERKDKRWRMLWIKNLKIIQYQKIKTFDSVNYTSLTLTDYKAILTTRGDMSWFPLFWL